jgi:hypothetical protein
MKKILKEFRRSSWETVGLVSVAAGAIATMNCSAIMPAPSSTFQSGMLVGACATSFLLHGMMAKALWELREDVISNPREKTTLKAVAQAMTERHSVADYIYPALTLGFLVSSVRSGGFVQAQINTMLFFVASNFSYSDIVCRLREKQKPRPEPQP